MLPRRGMRKGLISDLGPAARVVKAANEEAERVAQANIDECVVGVGGPHIRGVNTQGGFELEHPYARGITREDVSGTAVDHARSGWSGLRIAEILHLLPRQFILDGQPGIFDPIGMVGARLEGAFAYGDGVGERIAEHSYLRKSLRGLR